MLREEQRRVLVRLPPGGRAGGGRAARPGVVGGCRRRGDVDRRPPPAAAPVAVGLLRKPAPQPGHVVRRLCTFKEQAGHVFIDGARCGGGLGAALRPAEPPLRRRRRRRHPPPSFPDIPWTGAVRRADSWAHPSSPRRCSASRRAAGRADTCAGAGRIAAQSQTSGGPRRPSGQPLLRSPARRLSPTWARRGVGAAAGGLAPEQLPIRRRKCRATTPPPSSRASAASNSARLPARGAGAPPGRRGHRAWWRSGAASAARRSAAVARANASASSVAASAATTVFAARAASEISPGPLLLLPLRLYEPGGHALRLNTPERPRAAPPRRRRCRYRPRRPRRAPPSPGWRTPSGRRPWPPRAGRASSPRRL